MDLRQIIHFVLCCSVVPSGDAVEDGAVCTSPQYVTIGALGLIKCQFPNEFYSLIWYKSTDGFQKRLVSFVRDYEKSGDGFLSGEYDVSPNGSLIINNVSINHESTFTAVILVRQTSGVIQYEVDVFVVAPTFSRAPRILGCFNSSEICFKTLNRNSQVACIVEDARKAVSLTWMVRTNNGDQNISSFLSVTNETHLFFTSFVTTTELFMHSKFLDLLVCKVYSPPKWFERNESLVVLHNMDEDVHPVLPVKKYIEFGSKMELRCSHGQTLFLLWQIKTPSDLAFKMVVYSVSVGGYFKTYTNEDHYSLNNAGSLVVDNVRVHHEGLYRCFSGDGVRDDVMIYDVLTFVPSDPGYLLVDGCDYQQYCVLDVEAEGNLSCTVKRVRPNVELSFREVFQRSSNLIHFYDKSVTIRDIGDTVDVLLTTKYHYYGAAQTRLTVECKVIGTHIDDLLLSTKFDLLFLTGVETSTDESSLADEHYYWIIAIVLVVVLANILACRRVIVKGRDNMQHPTESGETIPMMIKIDPQDFSSEKRNMLISELKAKYRDLYAAVQPIPYIKDRIYCVDRVFVEGGIEYLVANDRIGGSGTWGKLGSYHNILDDDRVKSTRRIIEGEPGYGKSTLALQLSYDWCNKIQQSYLKDTDVLIVLRLQQLGGVTSVYRAIKLFLLPVDSKLTESDVSDIIGDCSSVLVILDGYDEYPDQDAGIDSDVISIIMRTMFQQFEVILITRSSYLPKEYPAFTKRLKLTGFDDNARDQYIRKAVVDDDFEAADKIKQQLKENPVIGDLCQVPLFFVIFAHMSYESDQFQKFNSVTSFFRYMISCLHSHMEKKIKDENVRRYDLFEINHRELDKLAFEGLSGKDQQILWSKKDMRGRLGHDFYDQYVRIGILIEEKVLDISDDPNSVMSEHIQYKTEVRFYHKLFCEWYAAHHLSEYASRDDVTFEILTHHILKYLDPFDLQYVYKFTCGLNPVAAEKIIGYLKTRRDASTFSILCILEKCWEVEGVLENVEDMCSDDVDIKSDDSLLLQRSTIQLLEIASANKIFISRVSLHDCYSTVYLSGEYHLQLKSSFFIPVLTTLNKLTIVKRGREITAGEFTDLLQYSSKCLALKELELSRCLLPQSVQAETVSILRSKNVKVIWFAYNAYQLNLQSCHWERINTSSQHVEGLMTDDDYQSEVRDFRAYNEE